MRCLGRFQARLILPAGMSLSLHFRSPGVGELVALCFHGLPGPCWVWVPLPGLRSGHAHVLPELHRCGRDLRLGHVLPEPHRGARFFRPWLKVTFWSYRLFGALPSRKASFLLVNCSFKAEYYSGNADPEPLGRLSRAKGAGTSHWHCELRSFPVAARRPTWRSW